MSKVMFTPYPDEARYKAEFYKGDDLVDWMWLSQDEADGLEEYLQDSATTIDAVGLYEELGELAFDDDGEGTAFEDNLYKLVKDEI